MNQLIIFDLTKVIKVIIIPAFTVHPLFLCTSLITRMEFPGLKGHVSYTRHKESLSVCGRLQNGLSHIRRVWQ